MKLAYSISFAIAALIFGSAAILLFSANQWTLSGADNRAIGFTAMQAGLSAMVSTLLAIPVARALFRRRFWGREALILLMSAPFVFPVVTAILGLLTIFGRNGPVNHILAMLGFAPFSIYGLHGIVIANVFFNLPLATRMLLHGWQSIPNERFRLAQSLAMTPQKQFQHLEWPMLRGQLGGIALTIYLVCLTSFAISLILGGGPRSSTIELSIYQSLRFDFDLGRAAMLAAVQFALCTMATWVALRVVKQLKLGAGLSRSSVIIAPKGARRIVDILVIFLAALFLIAPLLAAMLRGVAGLPDLPPSVWPALARSITVSLISAALSITAASILSIAVARSNHKGIEFAAMLPLAASGLVLGTGLFILLRPFAATSTLALPITVVANVALTLPFLYRLLLPQARLIVENYARLSASLGMTGWSEVQIVFVPLLARQLGYGAGLAAALSMGDLGVIALFADSKSATLPLLVQQLMGAYRMDQAASAALILVISSAALFFSLDRIGKRYANT